MRWRVILPILAATLLSACSSSGAEPSVAPPQPSIESSQPSVPTSGSPPAGPEAVDLTIFAAASLSGVLKTTKAAYETAHPGATLTISTDSSSALEMQIEQGAPADVFLSADTTNPEKLVKGGFAAGEAVIFATNELAVVVPRGNPARITTPVDLAKAGVKIVAAGDEVPITAYAKQLVANLSREPGYPADFEAAYSANVVSKEDNVKAVIAKIELGEGDAAIVYVTDAKASVTVATVDVPDSANVKGKYAGVVVQASPRQEAARTFLGWLTGPDGQAILSSFGFLGPSA
jgi:molybdate transport system substrate-binding protein